MSNFTKETYFCLSFIRFENIQINQILNFIYCYFSNKLEMLMLARECMYFICLMYYGLRGAFYRFDDILYINFTIAAVDVCFISAIEKL